MLKQLWAFLRQLICSVLYGRKTFGKVTLTQPQQTAAPRVALSLCAVTFTLVSLIMCALR